MNIGDLIVCIDTTGWDDELTYGKQYKVVMYNKKVEYVTIVHDKNLVFRFDDDRFVSLSEWRNFKLNQVLNHRQ